MTFFDTFLIVPIYNKLYFFDIFTPIQPQPGQNENGQVIENLPVFLSLEPKAGLVRKK
jgi:hypothetical protein